jgi:hypothetical protein
MNDYENMTNQTIQLFPQLFLGKQREPRASRLALMPSDNAGVSFGTMTPPRGGRSVRKLSAARRLGVRHKVNLGERTQVSSGIGSQRECGFNFLVCSDQESGRRSDGCPAVLRKPSAGGIKFGPKCLGKRQSVMTKETPSRSRAMAYPRVGQPVTADPRRLGIEMKKKQMPPVTRRIEGGSPSLPRRGTHPLRCNACRRLQVIHHEDAIAIG